MNEEPGPADSDQAPLEKAGEKQEIPRNPDGTFPPGVSGNPEGKKPGTLNWTTIFDQAIAKVAKANNMEAVDVEEQLIAIAVKRAREGDYRYYKDIMDRKYGQPKQKVDVGLDDEVTEVNIKIQRNEEQKS